MRLIVDTREHALLKLLPDLPRRQLPTGDFLLESDEGRPVLLVERKTYADLAGSIKDGRWQEQRRTMVQYRSDSGVTLAILIQGTPKDRAKLTPESIVAMESALRNITERLCVAVIYRATAEDCVAWLQAQLKHHEAPTRLLGEASPPKKKKARVRDRIGRAMLENVERVSPAVSSAIIDDNNFSIADLCDHLRKRGPEAFADTFVCKKRMGKALSASLHDALFTKPG